MLRRLLPALVLAALPVLAIPTPARAAPPALTARPALATPVLGAPAAPAPAAPAGPAPTTIAAAAPVRAAPSPVAPSADVKYYVVRDEFGGEPEFLFEIAQRFLGSGDRNDEIFQLNKGRLQPDGLRLTKPEAILPGWILQLPPDAEGEGIRTGPLPTVAPRATTSTSAALTPASDGLPWWKWASLASGAVLLLAGGALAAWWTARRRRQAAGSRPPSPAWPDTDRYYRLEDNPS